MTAGEQGSHTAAKGTLIFAETGCFLKEGVLYVTREVFHRLNKGMTLEQLIDETGEGVLYVARASPVELEGMTLEQLIDETGRGSLEVKVMEVEP